MPAAGRPLPEDYAATVAAEAGRLGHEVRVQCNGPLLSDWRCKAHVDHRALLQGDASRSKGNQGAAQLLQAASFTRPRGWRKLMRVHVAIDRICSRQWLQTSGSKFCA